MAEKRPDKQPSPNRRASQAQDGKPAKPTPEAGAEQAPINQKKAIESGEESPT